MRLIDADWLEEHERCYSFESRDDIRKFIEDAPEVSIMDAMEWIEGKKKDALAYEIGVRQNVNNITEEGWDIVVGALRKQIPKKPNSKSNIVRNYWTGECPVCGEFIDNDEKFCSECGQALDWSEE